MVARSEYKQWDPELKPLACPFCGETPAVLPADPEQEGDAWGQVQCLNSQCAVQPKCYDGAKLADMRGPGAYKDLAIRRWNNRA
jgi:hypothetical protein